MDFDPIDSVGGLTCSVFSVLLTYEFVRSENSKNWKTYEFFTFRTFSDLSETENVRDFSQNVRILRSFDRRTNTFPLKTNNF